MVRPACTRQTRLTDQSEPIFIHNPAERERHASSLATWWGFDELASGKWQSQMLLGSAHAVMDRRACSLQLDLAEKAHDDRGRI